MNFFLPIHGTGILLPDQYSFRSSLSSALQCNWKVTEPGVSVLDMQQRIREYRDIREYYYEDYYPLSGTGDLTGSDVWLAYQMHRPSDDSGIVVAFRRQDAPDAGIHRAPGRTHARRLLYPRGLRHAGRNRSQRPGTDRGADASSRQPEEFAADKIPQKLKPHKP